MKKLISLFCSMSLTEKVFCVAFYLLSFAVVILAILGFICLLMI